jgi:hypothetical protein
MDKKETTRLLSNLIQYNTVDINNMITTFPEIGKAFMNVISAIDEEYGSGSIDKNLLTPDPTAAQTKKVDFKEFGDSFIGKYLYKVGGKEWYYFDSLINYEQQKQIYTFRIYTNAAFSKSNVAEENHWPVKSLEEILSIKEVGGWKLFTLNVGDKVTLPKTKLGVAGYISGALREARLRGQNYLYIVEIQKNGIIVLWYDNIPANGDFFIMQDVEPYEENEEKLGFKVGDYYTSEKWTKGTWVKITDITQDQVNGLDEKGNPYLNYILNFKKELASGYFKIIPDPTVKNLTFKVGDEFTTEVSRKQNYTYNYIIDKIDGDKVVVAWTDQKGKSLTNYLAKDVQELFDKNTWQLVNNQPKKIDFKEGDTFYVQYSPKEIYTIKKINQKDIIIGYTNDAGKYKENARFITDAQENFDNGVWILTGQSNTAINYITNWRPDWKAMGLRPSPTRKASLGKVDDVGLGNDGIVYEIGEDKKGTKKWKKKGFNYFNPNVRALFTTYDKNLLIDQLNYENSQLDKTDVDYKENEKLIKQVLTEI